MTHSEHSTGVQGNDPDGSIFLPENIEVYLEPREFGDRLFALLQHRGEGADKSPNELWEMYKKLQAQSLGHLAIDGVE